MRFKCTECGICCGDTEEKTRHILLLEAEANDIAAVIGRPVPDFSVKLEGKPPYAYEMKKTAEEGKCLFLRQNRCTIYSRRPRICRFYPFGLETNQNHIVFYFTNECPGIGRGKITQEKYFQSLLSLAKKRAAKRCGSKDLER